MNSIPIAFFDRVASRYDETWTNSLVGQIQRRAVWRELDTLVRPNARVLDLGCGTGEDALHLSQRGATVVAIDSSGKMVEIACAKGVNARSLGIEHIGELDGAYDLVLSNFGALNCVADLSILRQPLERLVRPGGHLAICLMNRFCLWEFVYCAVRAQFTKATRRWSGTTETHGLRVFYPTIKSIERALSPSFRLLRDVGIGVSVPPSFVGMASPKLLSMLERLDLRIARSRFGRAIADHRLLIFVR